MSPTRFFAAVAILLAVAISASAQPKLSPAGPGQPLSLKGIGKAQESTPEVVAGWWTDTLIADLEQIKSEVAAMKAAPVAKKAIIDRADHALDKAYAMEKALGQNKRDLWFRAYGDVEGAQAELTKAVAQNAGANPTVYLALDRANYAMQQLGVGLLVGDTSADHLKQVLSRLAQALDEQAERLRFSTGELGPIGKPLEAELRKFVGITQKFAKETGGNADLNRIKREFGPVAGKWPELARLITFSVNLPPDIRYQTSRVDGIYRELARMLGVVTPPLPPPPGPPPRPEKLSVLAVGAGEGMEPLVVVYSDDKGTIAHSFYAYNRTLHRSGIRVAVADLNGDGFPEIITINGGQGHARIKVFDGRDTNPILTFDGFDQKVLPWGFYIAAADLTRDGRALVAIAPDAGGPPAVEVYDLAQGKLLTTVQPFPRNFEGGVRLAWGDVNGDGIPDLICATGPGQIASMVKVFDGTNFTRVLGEFIGVDDKYKGGLWVAAADLTKNNRAEIVIGLDGGSRPLVRVFDGTKGKFIAEYEPFPKDFRGGVRVAIGDPDDGAKLKIICAPGPGGQNLPIKLLRLDGKPHSEMDPFPKSNKGMFIGSR